MQGGTPHAVLLTPQTTVSALASPAAPAPPAAATGAIHPTAAAPAASARISAVAPDAPALGVRSTPAPTADRATAPPTDLPIFDFALADLAARPRTKTPRTAGSRFQCGRIRGSLEDRMTRTTEATAKPGARGRTAPGRMARSAASLDRLRHPHIRVIREGQIVGGCPGIIEQTP
jgi:hypothetical protein